MLRPTILFGNYNGRFPNNIGKNSTRVMLSSILFNTLQCFLQNWQLAVYNNYCILELDLVLRCCGLNVLHYHRKYVIYFTCTQYSLLTTHERKPVFIKFVHSIQNTYFLLLTLRSYHVRFFRFGISDFVRITNFIYL